MKHLRETFEEKEFKRLLEAKSKIAENLGLKKISWHDYLLEQAGVVLGGKK